MHTLSRARRPYTDTARLGARRLYRALVDALDSESQPAAESLSVWMDDIELSQLRALIEAIEPQRVLEWGSGGSTRAVLETCPFIERYVSIEHNAAWFEKVRNSVQDPRLELYLKQPSIPEPTVSSAPGHTRTKRRKWMLRAETDRSILADYIDFPATLGTLFDFVLIDGRARSLCARQGIDLLRPGGLLVMHDAQREEYHDALNEVGRAVFLEPWVQGQFCVVRKTCSSASERDVLPESAA